MPPSTQIAEYKINDFTKGEAFSFLKTIREADAESFAQLSGDINPLHMSNTFAKQRGFKGRVIHGLLLSSYLSQLIGIHFPGKHAILHAVNLHFLSPAYIDETIEVKGVIEQISLSTQTLVLRVTVENKATNKILIRGKVQVGFTERIDSDG